ncbi:cystathionine beta-lyase [Phaeovibrio sulfidiphilus]|uniref:Cystathionine beta-lyase n=1 Tax=Phaeovibrio sulfidiphilus TaxID=1220600 RepID=A0A8J7CCB0_9PROT|nr:cystathionine beta-lyase [Phaeovibrio sulfidiphilus]MBE1237068.1 cystathionine beta-lyase [Phaeovibrio sulfidiphilus]
MAIKKDTAVTRGGRDSVRFEGAVNPPVYRASTIAFESVEDLDAAWARRFDRPYYGRYGTVSTLALEQALAAAEGAEHAVVTASGMGAIAGTLLAILRPGDHLLMADTVYQPARDFCDTHLARFGVATTYYDPRAGEGLRHLIRPETRVVYCESPGSLTFEVQDIPALSRVAREAGALVVMDNTWASPLGFPALERGVDIAIQSCTKYIVGHSDAMLGSAALNDRGLYERIKETLCSFGYACGSEEAFLGLRGLRTLSVRLERHMRNALEVARWLETRDEVERVLYPPLESDPGHALWGRDFTGAGGLMGVMLKPAPAAAVRHMVDGLSLFSLGFSWGGYESLALVTTGHIRRTAVPWTYSGPVLRLHIGLEDPQDLILDLERGLARLRDAQAHGKG